MKISKMTTDQAADVLVRIVEPAANIVHDEEVYKDLGGIVNGSNEDALKFLAANIVPITTALLKTHRLDVYEIVAALSEKTVDEVAKQKITVTIKDIKESWDGELLDFLGSLK